VHRTTLLHIAAYFHELEIGEWLLDGEWIRARGQRSTPRALRWGEQYHARIFVSRESLRLIEARGGGR
jgi:hypothetical protein